jgi:flavin-dependent dehydrogenase
VEKHDVIVIGGSLAGAACVRELCRLGVDAVAYERDRFPRPRVCGGFVSPGGVDCLDNLGLLEEVRRAGATRVYSATVHIGDAEVEIPFNRPGLGISRQTLDHIVARSARVEQGCGITNISRVATGFVVSGSGVRAHAPVLIDASGKLSRFTRRSAVNEFGVQFTGSTRRVGVLDFWFFNDGYGGAVNTEGALGNFCFLIRKDRLERYIARPDCMVTGPLAYERVSGDVIAVGDAAGMVDPFCGEGMRHALDSARTAARIVARGLRSGREYDEIRGEYQFEWSRRWSRKREVGAVVRRMLKHPRIVASTLRLNPGLFLRWMWG